MFVILLLSGIGQADDAAGDIEDDIVIDKDCTKGVDDTPETVEDGMVRRAPDTNIDE